MLPFVFVFEFDLIIIHWYKIEISVYGRPFLTSDSNHLASNNHIIWTFSISYLVYIAIIVFQQFGIGQVVCIILLLLGILVVLLQFAYKDFMFILILSAYCKIVSRHIYHLSSSQLLFSSYLRLVLLVNQYKHQLSINDKVQYKNKDFYQKS